MPKYYTILFLVFFCGIGKTQTHNNWINYNQKYYKIPIVAEGLYRVNPQILSDAGIDLNTVNPKNFQLFHRGKEIPIYVHNENDPDGIFNGTDFIEFYGNRNSGWMDSLIYDSPNNLLNPIISLFNDTISYFLTWNNQSNNLRMVNDVDQNPSGFNSRSYIYVELSGGYNTVYQPGGSNSTGGFDPEYNVSEGWGFGLTPFGVGGGWGQLGARRVHPNFPFGQAMVNVYSVSDDPQQNIDNRAIIRLNYTLPGQQIILDTSWNGVKNIVVNKTFSFAGFDTTQNVRINVENVQLNTNNNQQKSFNWLGIKYYRTLNIDNANRLRFFFINDSSQARTVYNFYGGNFSGNIYLYDFGSKKRLVTQTNNGVHQFVIDNIGQRKMAFICSESMVNIVPRIFPAGNNGTFTNYLESENKDFLIITHTKLLGGANQYAAYKASKGFNPLVVDVEQLYDQFAYGIRKNPISMREFVKTYQNLYGNSLKNVFLIGKSILNNLARNNSVNHNLNLVPTWGYFGSDGLITARINGSEGYAPSVPVGRLSATTNDDVQVYLNKVIEFENQPKAMWMKDILHFAGGTTIGEQQQHLMFLNNYKNMLQDTLFGGRVVTFKKTSSAPVQIAEADSIRDMINNGVSIMNFFGHAAGSSFDVSPEPPSQYNNQGKYPLIMANSCYVGDLHQPPNATYQFVSEQYILIPNKGAIAFIAQSSPGLASPGYFYTRAFYDNLGRKKYGQSIGASIKAAIEDIQSPNDIALKEACLTMTLHGDPSLRLNPFPAPDYEINNQSVEFEPTIITTDLDSFFVRVNIKNKGYAVNKPMVVVLKRYLPDSLNATLYSKTLPAVMYETSTLFKLPVNLLRGPGVNKMEVFIDALNLVEESDETNNKVEILFDIKSDDIIPVFPIKNAIVKTNTLTLKASTGDVFAPVRNYIFQIDTTDLFNSPLKKNTTVNISGGVVKWTPPLTFTDSTVYFWRVSPDSTSPLGYKWKESSFQFIQNRKGWEQAHFFQYKNNDFSLMKYNRLNRLFEFGQLNKVLTCFTWSAPQGQIPPDADLFATEFRIDQQLIESAGISYNAALHVAVMDSTTLEPWSIRFMQNGVIQNPNNNFGNANDMNPVNGHFKYFVFNVANAQQMQGFKNMISNGVPNGNYLLIYTWIRGNFQSWADTSIFTVLENLGADSVRFLPNSRAWAFFVKKGYPQTAVEEYSPSNGRFRVSLSGVMTSNVNYGEFTSEKIGPSMGWDSLSWRSKPIENNIEDSVRIDVYGIKFNGEKQKLLTFFNYNGNQLLSSIDHQTYPYLQLKFFSKDQVNLTPAQLKRWHVFYKPVPEAALNPNVFVEQFNPTYQQGEPLKFKIGIENVSDLDMDSLLIKYWLVNAAKQVIPLTFPRQDSLKAGEFILPEISINNRNLSGDYNLWIDVNPLVDNDTRYDQPEQTHFNNVANVKFNISGDRINPVMDVTFDGRKLIDGDIVSPNPNIVAVIKDENKFLALRDTAKFSMFLKYPDETQIRKINFSSSPETGVQFIPATLPENKCKLIYKPSLEKDGVYELRVSSRDESNNASGTNDYVIRFEVVNKSSITNVMNYPNPFSTSTRFVFTLTGSKVPDRFRIQIMTITGKVVREINQDEIGPIQIGRNITPFAWDGTDQFGDRLANGLYLYRVFSSIEGENIELRESGADEFFHKGYGKMYLVR